MNPFISVIIPVYKVEKYLKKCVESVLQQKYKDFEIVLVDDGSPDRCPEICDEFAFQDDRVKVIHKENGGSSDARNIGIQVASGEYIMFLDSDDYWDTNDALTNIVYKLKDKLPDVLLHGCKDFNLITNSISISRGNYDINKIENLSKGEMFEYLFKEGLFPGSAWIVVTKRKFIIENNLYFIKGIKGEDYDWLLNVFMHGNRFTATNDTFYVYLKYRTDSITSTGDLKSIEGIIKTIEKWYPIISEEANSQIKRNVLGHLGYMLGTVYTIYDNLSINDKLIAKKLIKDNIFLLSYSSNKKIKIIKMCSKFLGIDLTSKICREVYMRKKYE